MISYLEHPLMLRSADIAAMVPYWNQVTAIVEGLKSVRAATTDFLPQFPDEPPADYAYRLSLSKLTNVYRDVLEGLATKPFEEEVTLIGGEQIPEALNDFIENVDGSGNNLSTFAALTFFQGINSAIDWIFVDYPTVQPGTVITVADAKARNLKPFWSHVIARNVFEVRTKIIGSKETIVYFRMFEPALNGVPDRVRVFERSDAGIVTWVLWQHNPEATTEEQMFVKVGEGVLSIGVIPMVPFSTGRRDGKSFKFYPAMQDAADLQVTLYQNESALEYVKVLAGYPMLAANGMKPEKDAQGNPKKVAVGPGRVLYAAPDGQGNHGDWKFVEPSANSMEFLQKNIAQTKQDLRELGRQPLTALSTQLTTVTTSIAAGKAKSAVTAWALLLKDALENALVLTLMWMKVDYDPEVNVYTGFDNVLDDGSDLDTLNTARDRGDLSQETYWFELKRRKVLSPEFKAEDEQKKILKEIPSDEPDDDDPNPQPA